MAYGKRRSGNRKLNGVANVWQNGKTLCKRSFRFAKIVKIHEITALKGQKTVFFLRSHADWETDV